MQAAGFGQLTGITLFAFWGCGWFVVWAIYRQGWMLLVTIGCFIAPTLAGALRDQGAGSLVFGIGFLLLSALPGLLIIRKARRLG